MYYNNKGKKKEYLSDPIEIELEWVNDLPWQKRIWFNKLNPRIAVAYTYYIYHGYSIGELACLNLVPTSMMIEWILTAAYVVDGKYVKFDDNGFVLPGFWTNIYKRFPNADKTVKCKDCVWADLKTGYRICFRNCDHGDCYQRRCSK